MQSSCLKTLLKERFGFDRFRPTQEKVCEAVLKGEDVLLVMPTGAGKSLCYQLPGLARGGTTVVISPLLALIDDQVSKLKAMGLRAEQIHSGRSREDSRTSCIRYLQGELDFLFIAPERLAVRGFPEMLEKRKPTLVAIDEAHCISQWGHDFRPEYRKLGQRLERLRPSPIMALTATATPIVQEDIAVQLGMKNPRRFIQGFRRTNIAIRTHEVPPSSRGRAAVTLLKVEGRIPAIIYATTRKMAEEIADEVSKHFKAKAYHAGMTPNAREDVQTSFLAGKLDVIVATVAFGMGIDKSNVRTVIHAGLSGSVEGYYQEIGRAGRDGLPSEAILLYSYGDQKTHEFFFERDYPEVPELEKIYRKIQGPIDRETLQSSLRMDAESFEKALEKLWIHGGVMIAPDETISPGDAGWSKSYHTQRAHRQKSISQMLKFTETRQCRMVFFLDHFGDHEDLKEACGVCDRCNPSVESPGQFSRTLSESERGIAALILARLEEVGGQSVGRLFEDSRSSDRKNFEAVLESLVQAGMVSIRAETFDKGSETISYRKASITAHGERAKGKDLEAVTLRESEWMGKIKKEKKSSGKSKAILRKQKEEPSSVPLSGDDSACQKKLKEWRLSKARELGVPAFRVFGDRVLRSLAVEKPRTLDELLNVRGLGPKLRDKYGAEILSILKT
jgi:RecQ family ATP-dependent DNA helicase